VAKSRGVDSEMGVEIEMAVDRHGMEKKKGVVSVYIGMVGEEQSRVVFEIPRCVYRHGHGV
jgi:hypothetical protein